MKVFKGIYSDVMSVFILAPRGAGNPFNLASAGMGSSRCNPHPPPPGFSSCRRWVGVSAAGGESLSARLDEPFIGGSSCDSDLGLLPCRAARFDSDGSDRLSKRAPWDVCGS